MQAMILAAGFGRRMLPLTLDCPKPLLEVAGEPMIVHHIKRLARAGITDIIINLAWLGEQIIAFLQDGGAWGVNIRYSVERNPLETAGGIQKALPLLRNQPFWVVNGDVFCNYDFSLAELRSKDMGCLLLVDNPPHHLKGDFYIDSGRVRTQGDHSLTFSGISLLRPDLFKDMSPGHAALGPLLKIMAEKDNLAASHFQGSWFDVGTRQALTNLNQALSK